MKDAKKRARPAAPRPAPPAAADPRRLFQDKLRPPEATRAGTLARPEALLVSSALAGARLVLVTAPAGFGKTTAICQYERALRDRGVATSWITLDSDDNDLGRFTAYLCAAIRKRVVPAVAAGRATPQRRRARRSRRGDRRGVRRHRLDRIVRPPARDLPR